MFDSAVFFRDTVCFVKGMLIKCKETCIAIQRSVLYTKKKGYGIRHMIRGIFMKEENKEQMLQREETARNNKLVTQIHMLSTVVITIFILLQLVSGRASVLQFLITLLLGPCVSVAMVVLQKKEAGNQYIKHIASYGFATFFTYEMLTSSESLVFILVVPMVYAVTVYGDVKYLIKINLGIFILNIITIAGGATTGKFGYSGSDKAIVQMVGVMLMAIASQYTVKTLQRNNALKMENIIQNRDENLAVLQQVSSLSKKLEEGVREVHEQLEKLASVSLTTKEAMQQVTNGTIDTSNAVSSQLEQTESIQGKVKIVNESAEIITNNMNKTVDALEKGNKDVEDLIDKANESVQNGKVVVEKLEKLDAYMNEMNTIVEIINNITEQTSLLALNASIEAARAGDAGKGFAVVASEISGMATQTQDATLDITALINNVSSAINEVVKVVYNMIEGINEEKEKTEETAKSFVTISDNTQSIRGNIDSLANHVEKLQTANQEIVTSIHTISSISEALTEHANETMNAEEENEAVRKEIETRMQELMDMVKENKSETE